MKRTLVLPIVWATATLLLPCDARAAIITYQAFLSGSNENPATGSPGTGFAEVTIDDIANLMEVEVTFAGLTTPNTAAHIHCCVTPPNNAGVATVTPTFTGFPTGAIAGSYDHTFSLLDAASYNPAFVTAQGGLTAARAALLAGLAANQAYLNIHTQAFGGGEIRGFLAVPQTTVVPEPASLSLLGIGLAGLSTRRWRQRNR